MCWYPGGVSSRLASLFLFCCCLPQFAAAQTMQSRAARVGPPTAVTATQAAMAEPPANLQQYADQKQARLNEHFRPTIELVPTAGAVAAAAAEPPVPQTTVIGGPVRAASQLQFFTNHALTAAETRGITSTVCEPSVAVRGNEVLITGNWFAGFSTNAGQTFQYINPDTTFPAAGNGQRFCCDQVVIYDRQHDLMCWYLQYINDAAGNTGRLAVAQGDDIARQAWRYYDFTPQSIGAWSGEWLDFPDLALSENSLYVTSNVFGAADDRFRRAVVLRLPLADLAGYRALDYRYFETNQVASIRPTQGAGDTMYLGAHRNLNSIRVFSWADSATTIAPVDVPVQAWSDNVRVAPGPDGRDWVGRADGRITAAALAGNQIAFAWTAAHAGEYRKPHVRVALIDKDSKQVVAQPHIRNDNFAFAYPALAANSQGQLGISLHFGGGTLLPSHTVGVLDTSSGFAWNLLASANGTHGPSSNRWGDYLAVRPHGAVPSTWVATGFTLQGGTERANVAVTYLHFGFELPSPSPPDGECEQKLQRTRQELQELREELQRMLERIDRLNQDLSAADSRAADSRLVGTSSSATPCCR